MSNLIKLYQSRLKGIVINSIKDLKYLLEQDEKRFYFLLMYWYLINKEINFDISSDVILSSLITLFCLSCNDNSIIQYYSKYVDLTEIPIQISKIYKEIK